MNYLAEFVGTMVLILFGNGVCTSITYKRMHANQAGKHLVAVIAWGFAVSLGVLTCYAINKGSTLNAATNTTAFINPAVALFAAIKDKKPEFLLTIPCQLLGAMVAQVILSIISFRAMADEELGTIRGTHTTGGIYDNKKEHGLFFNFVYEFVGTSLLILMVVFVLHNGIFGSAANIPVKALIIGVVVMAIIMSFGSHTGAALNPARDLGPRIVFHLFTAQIYYKYRNKFVVTRTVAPEDAKKHIMEVADWQYGLLVPVLAPMTAGLVIGLFGLITV